MAKKRAKNGEKWTNNGQKQRIFRENSTKMPVMTTVLPKNKPNYSNHKIMTLELFS